MKKSLTILALLLVSFAGFSQQEVLASNDTELTKVVKADTPKLKKSVISAKVKAKVLKINRKKSNEIISIKAYRKSLQIKVKTVKLC